MKVSVLKYLFLLAGMCLWGSAFTHVTLDYPVGGESFEAGEVVTVDWHEDIPHNQIDWDLYFSPDNGNNWEALQLSIPVSITYYDWTVPEMNTSQGLIKIVQDNEGMDYDDVSFSFSITAGGQPPAITVDAQDITINCGPDQNNEIQNWLDDAGGAVANISCGNSQWSNDYSGLSDGCGMTGSATVQFTVTDDCDNTAVTTATVTVGDNTPPGIQTQASDITVTCDGAGNGLQDWLSTQGGAQASDGCSGVTWSDDFAGISEDCGEMATVTVVFTATDACGNSSTTSATVTAEDNVSPEIQTPASDMTVACDGEGNISALQGWLSDHAGAVMTDNCGEIMWSDNFSELSDGCGETGSATVVFTATDVCGNSTTTAATFHIADNTAPVVEQDAALIQLECDGSGNQSEINSWLASHGGAIVTDDCSSLTWSDNFNALSDKCGATGNTQVTFTATDACGNSVVTSAVILILDQTPPEIHTVARDTTFSCEGDTETAVQQWLEDRGGARATDMCGEITWSHDFVTPGAFCESTQTIDVAFVATDECDNASTTSATLTIEKTTSTADAPEETRITVFPNPSSRRIYIAFPGATQRHVTLYDMGGQQVWNDISTGDLTIIETAGIGSGTYVLTVEDGGNLVTRCVVIR